MSMRYPGGLIATSPVNARYPSGVWTQAQAAPYQAQNVWTRDQFWPNTTLLLQGDGAVNGAQNNTFLDSSSNNFTITRNGNTTQGSFSPYEQDGYWSNYFDGASSLLPASSAAFNFGTGDFTVEAWVYQPASGTQCVYDCRGSDASAAGFFFGTISTNFAIFTNNTTAISTPMQLNTWMHFAIVRSGSTWTLYKNGVSAGTYSSSANLSDANRQIGASTTVTSSSANYLTGYISNLRVIKGTAVYTSAFTPSTAPLTAVTNTSLLTCQSNRFKDNSTNAFAITVNGSPSVQSFQPFPGATTWSASVLGGSGYFDGSGDYLQAASNAAFALSGDFTINAWIYPTSTARSTISAVGNGIGGIAININTSGNIEVCRAGTAIDFTFTANIKPFQWSYVSVIRSGTNMTAYLNGVSLGTQTNATSYNQSYLNIGYDGDGASYPFVGYMASYQMIKGTAVVPPTGGPTSPLTSTAGTSMLLNFTNAGIYDNAQMNDLETVGNAQISTSVVKYGTGSMYFDGNGDVLSAPDNEIIRLSSGDFTIECWVYPTANGALYDSGFASYGAASTLAGWFFGMSGTNTGGTLNRLVWSINYAVSGGAPVYGNAGLPLNTWSHVAVTKLGTTISLFINGNLDKTATVTATPTTSTTYKLYVGAASYDPTGTQRSLTGYIDDLRITKGAARYITTFTPPPARMPAQ